MFTTCIGGARWPVLLRDARPGPRSAEGVARQAAEIRVTGSAGSHARAAAVPERIGARRWRHGSAIWALPDVCLPETLSALDPVGA